MYLRQSKQKRADGREITYLQLAENVWDATKGRSQAQIVFNCGRADDPGAGAPAGPRGQHRPAAALLTRAAARRAV